MLKYKSAFECAINLIKNRDYTEDEIKTKLSKYNFSNDEIIDTINRLKKQKYIDDKKYTDNFIKKCIDKGMGLLYIRNKLMEKGVSTENIEDELKNNGFTFEKECQIAEKTVSKMLVKKKNIQKLSRLLYARGFTEEVIEEVMRNIERNLNGK